MKELYLNNNQIEEIKNLPNSLISLQIEGNKITEINNLPNSLICLYICENRIIEIKNLSNSLTLLNLYNNSVEYINPDLLENHSLKDELMKIEKKIPPGWICSRLIRLNCVKRKKFIKAAVKK